MVLRLGGAGHGRRDARLSDLVLALVEQEVGGACHDLFFSCIGHLAVVKVIPLAVVLVPGITSIVSVSESAVVVGHRDQVIWTGRFSTVHCLL